MVDHKAEHIKILRKIADILESKASDVHVGGDLTPEMNTVYTPGRIGLERIPSGRQFLELSITIVGDITNDVSDVFYPDRWQL